MSAESVFEAYEDQMRRLWDGEVATTGASVAFDNYLTMSDEIDGKRYPILVGVYEDGLAEGEIISNSFFEEIVAEAGLDFDVEVPDNVEQEISLINFEEAHE